MESIQIGEYSFSDFAGEFELKNLPQLQSIQIGTVGRYSYNFCSSSFVIRGSKLIKLSILDLPHVYNITLGWSAFSHSKLAVFESMK